MQFLDNHSAAFGGSPSAGPSRLQQGVQEAVNAATVLQDASKKDDEDEDASMDGHHEMLRGRQREALWREVAATRIDLTVLGHGPPSDLVQSGFTERGMCRALTLGIRSKTGHES